MSEERGKRDETSEDVSTSDSSTSDATASSSESAASSSDSAASSSDSAASSSDTPSEASSARPTGKRATRRSRPVSVEKTPAATTTAVASRAEKSREPKRMNIFKRLRKFLREVIAELRKVIWPNRKQMVTYTSVVLVFVTFMVAYISGLDLAFIKGVGWLFG